jgi:HK97 family phage prohead protease
MFDRIEVKFAADEVTEKGVFTGYGAVFGNVDSYGDVIAKGAFKASLKSWKAEKRLPPMLSQHGGWMMGDMDAIPIGVWEEMAEDDHGLAVKGRLINLDTERGKTLYGAIKEDTMGGMSIGYRAKKFSLGTKPTEPRRTLEEIDLVEVSVVTFPANDRAKIESVKNGGQITTIRAFESFLRDAGGFSHAQAKAIAGMGFKASDPRDEDGAELADLIRRNIEKLST